MFDSYYTQHSKKIKKVNKYLILVHYNNNIKQMIIIYTYLNMLT